jgi:hypothetical protein
MVIFLYIKSFFRKKYGSGGFVDIGVYLFACSPGGRVSFFPSKNNFLFLKKKEELLRNSGQQVCFFEIEACFEYFLPGWYC